MNFVNLSEWFWLDCFLRMSANEWSFSEIRNGKRFILASSESRNRRQNFSFDNPTALSLPVMILRSLMQWSTEWEVERENRFVHFAKKKFVIQDWYFDCGVLVILYHRKLVKEHRNYFLVTGRNKRDSQRITGVCEFYSGAYNLFSFLSWSLPLSRQFLITIWTTERSWFRNLRGYPDLVRVSPKRLRVNRH